MQVLRRIRDLWVRVYFYQRPLDRHRPRCQSQKMKFALQKGQIPTKHQETKHMESTNPKYIWKLRVPKNLWKTHVLFFRLLGPSKNHPYPISSCEAALLQSRSSKCSWRRHLRLEPVSFSSIFGLKKILQDKAKLPIKTKGPHFGF